MTSRGGERGCAPSRRGAFGTDVVCCNVCIGCYRTCVSVKNIEKTKEKDEKT